MQISWVGVASKLLYAPDGSMTGWSFADSNDAASEFKIMADKFSITDGSGHGEAPFSINGNKVQFNGVVNFSNSDTSQFETTIKQNYLPLHYSVFRHGYVPPIVSHNTSSYGVATKEATGFCRFGFTSNDSDSYINFGKSANDYNIDIIPNRKWMISFEAASQHTGNSQVFLMTSDGNYAYGTVYLSTGHTRVYTIVDLSSNSSTKAQLRIDNDTGTSNYMWVGNIMMELLDSGQTEPSTFVAPSADMLSLYDTNTTTIDGGKITTGTLFSNFVGTEIIYDRTHWNNGVEQSSNTYKMKIDLNGGSIHIK